MSRVIVSIISEQTIPNYIFIKEMYQEGDKLIFISSKQPQILKKVEYIKDVLHLSCQQTLIEFDKSGDEEDSNAMERAIRLHLSPDEEYLVNLTGGTKYMALITEQIFSSYNSSFYYIPFPKNVILELHSNAVRPISYRVSVEEYMNLYGIQIRNKCITQDTSYTKLFFNLYLMNALSQSEWQIVDKMRSYRDKGLVVNTVENKEDEPRRPRIEMLNKFLKFIEFPMSANNKLSKYEVQFLTGGWFEEYVYELIHSHISPTDIRLGVEIQRTNTTNMNDLDVVFTKGNKLFVIECKTGLKERSLFNETMYKASALKETLLGLSGSSFIFSLSSENLDLTRIAKNMGITYCDKTFFTQPDKFDLIANQINGYAHE